MSEARALRRGTVRSAARAAKCPHRWRRVAAAICLGTALGLLPGAQAALAQGQESETAPMGPQTTARPAPLLSSIASVSVPSGRAMTPPPIPVARPAEPGSGLALPGSVRLESPARLACGDIQDDTARARCEARTAPPAPPAEGLP